VGDTDYEAQQVIQPAIGGPVTMGSPVAMGGPVHDAVQEEEEEAAELASPDRAVNEPLASKFWTWDVIQRGDCFCRRALLTLWSDGLGAFTAFTSTTSSGDVWIFRSIRLLGPYGEIFRMGQFNGPRMELTAHDYFVLRDRYTTPLVFPQQLFPIIQSVNMYCSC
jgi:hypothetical protein